MRPPGISRPILRALRQSGESRPARRSSSAVKEVRPSIVILPFQNRGRDEEDEYFSDGVTEDIISTLGNIEGLRVIPRASAFHFKGKRPSLSEVTSLLNVSHILEGSVRRAGDRLRITVELIDSAEGEQLWTQRYDRVMEDIFDVQDEISRAVADALKVKLLGDAGTRPPRRGTTDVEAYDLVLKGRHLANQYRRESLEQSLKCLKQARSNSIRQVCGKRTPWSHLGYRTLLTHSRGLDSRPDEALIAKESGHGRRQAPSKWTTASPESTPCDYGHVRRCFPIGIGPRQRRESSDKQLR